MNIQIFQRRGLKVRMQPDEDDDELDPELQNEVEIHFVGNSARGLQSSARDMQSSGKSRQTVSRKSSSKKSDLENDTSRVVKSRGRPMKAHETEPFLSIDNLPADTTFVSEKSAASSTRPPTYRTVPHPKSPAGQRTSVPMSPYTTPRFQSETRDSEPLKKTCGLDLGQSSKSRTSTQSRSESRQGSRSGSRQGSRQGSRPGSRSQLSRRATPANSPFATPRKQLSYPNQHVKSPFKHAVFKPDVVLEGRQTPSHDLKERTTQAAFYIHRLMAMSTDKEPARVGGKLKKGRLKPLYPVNVEGPSIERCRGIVSEARSYGASPSRTLQRRIHLMNTIPNVHEYLMEHRPCTTESVHQTSAASSDEEVANMQELYDEDNMDSNRSIPDKEVYDIESGEGQDGEPMVHTPEKTASPVITSEDVNAMKEPDVESKDSSLAETPTPRMFATELGTRSPEVVSSDVTVPKHHQQELSMAEPSDSQQVQDENTNVIENKSKPDTDTDMQKGRSTSPSKSVRFAEEMARQANLQNSKEIKQQTNIAKQQKERQGSADGKNKKKKSEDNGESVKKKNKQNVKSCKSDDINEIYRKGDDDDDDKDNDKNKNKGNQNEPYSSTRGSSGKNRQDKSNDSKSTQEQNLDSQGQKRSRSTKPRSQSPLRGHNCSKFLQSSASKPHKNILQVQTVIHSDTAQNILGPESPSRSRSPTRASPIHWKQSDQDFLSKYPMFSADSAQNEFDYASQRSKVKFMIEGEENQLETIFIEDENTVCLRPGQDMTFETIESELESLRHIIQNKLSEHQNEEIKIDDKNYDDVDIEAEELDATKTLIVEGRNLATLRRETSMDRTQADYTELIEKYRKKCMDRSEFCGAFSDMLVSPRKKHTYAYPNSSPEKPQFDPSGNVDNSAIDSNSPKLKSVENCSVIHVSDSGCGSIENLSEFSRSASVTLSDVPRLNLEGNTSDLDDTEPSSSRHDKDDDKTIVDESEYLGDRNILELVCDVLPASESKQKKTDRKQTIRKMMKSHKIQREEDVSKLKVVATTKCLSKPPQQKLTMSRSSSIPFPPLCFTINARPPAGYLYYFAYGPDMNPNRFSSYIKREVEDRFWALLFGFSLVFNKKGASIEAGGFANLEFNPLRSVEGCMYKITPEELEVLDKYVGYPEHYEHLVLPVWFSNSKDPENYGVCQYCVPALTYIAQNDWTETESTLPCDYSLSQCIKSADICTQEYRDSLVNMTRQLEVSA